LTSRTESGYTESFFAQEGDLSSRAAREVVPLLIRLVRPSSVVDVGCGAGSWLKEFQVAGVADVLGIDFHVQESSLRIPREKFLRSDLQRPISVPRRFDMVLCMEVAEHLPRESADILVQSLVNLGPIVIFSAALPYQLGSASHVNEEWPEWWVKLFSARGYKVIDCIRELIWLERSVPYWYSQNLLMFVSSDIISRYGSLKTALEKTDDSRLSLVHPRAWLSWSLVIIRHRKLQQMTRTWLLLMARSISFTIHAFQNGNKR
jgi:SAM-dependent methyltransferase